MRKFVVVLLALLLVPAWVWPQGFGKNKIQYQRKSWQYIQSQHFDIYFYEGGENVAAFTDAIAESSLTALKKSLQFDLMARIPILVYNSHNDFEETNVTPESEAPIIPKATRNHGDCLLAVKKVLVSAPFDVCQDIAIKAPK